MGEPSIVQRLLREKALGRYLDALERGDISTIIRVLEQAERDRVLERMILEVHETCQAEEEFLAMAQEENWMEIDGIHKSRIKGQQDEPAEVELVPEPSAQRKRGKPARRLRVQAAVLLVALVVGGFLLLHNAYPMRMATTSPSSKWCSVEYNHSVASINALTALSPGDVWAIGTPMIGAESVFMHWDGARWDMSNGPILTRVMTGFPGLGEGIATTLASLYALSANNIWSVGAAHMVDQRGGEHTLIEHWDGSQWQFVKSPNKYPSSAGWNDLHIVSASSASDVWAAGFAAPVTLTSANSPFSALMEHWDGQTWSLVSLPDSLGKNFLPLSIAAIAPDDVWLAGDTEESSQKETNHVLHWDGKSWTTVQLPASFGHALYIDAVAGISANNVWAFGGINNAQRHQGEPLIIHWDGNQWTRFPVATVGKEGSSLNSATVVGGANNVWVAGDAGNSTISQPFLEHWNGQSWQQTLLAPGKAPESVTNLAEAGSKVWALRTTDTNPGISTRIETNC
ncbi:MAG TPA: hypothetical protein VN729_12990 [Ktedonobacteraceae bacterium]|nr:hypothetical protein [Ktedonobacteraceae bacterium]